LKVVNAADLMQKDFPELRWVVDGVVPQGLTILAGRPKSGKSYMMLQIAADVAHGRAALRHFPVESATVLYFALEDTERRIQERLQQLDPNSEDNSEGLANLHFSYQLPRLAEGGMDVIEQAVREHGYKLIVIDTFGRVAATRRANDTFRADYDEVGMLQQLAQKLGISIVVIHHTRKPVVQARADADDPMDRINGTTGITAAADQLLVIGRVGEAQALHVISRDAPSYDWEVRREGESPMWAVAGKLSGQSAVGPQRRRVLDLLNQKGPMNPKDIAAALKRKPGATRTLLYEMFSDGQVYRLNSGAYDTVANPQSNTTDGANRLTQLTPVTADWPEQKALAPAA
jgi:hypothetical protein